MERLRVNGILRQIEANELRELNLCCDAGIPLFPFLVFLQMISE
jgi:hypothetical protein